MPSFASSIYYRRMRYFTLLLFSFAALLPEQATAQKFKVTTSVDSLTGVRKIASEDLRRLPIRSYSGSHAAFRAVYKENSDGERSWALVLFGYASDTTDMSRANRVRLRVDGKGRTPRRIASRTRTMNEKVVEVKRLVFSQALFKEIARTDSLTLSIGDARFEVNRTLRTDMRLILNEVAAAPARRAADAPPPSDTTTAGRNSEE